MPLPVILDTDIGGDIDDTWALAMLLKCPELDLKLTVGSYGDTTYRARLLAKLLQAFERTDIPIGIGPARGKSHYSQLDWLGNYYLSDYPGTIHADGAAAIIDLIHQSPEPVTLIGIGPAPTIQEVLHRDPTVTGKARFVGMYGSLKWSHHGDHQQIAEYNVACDIPACQAALSAPWPKTITPLDTCGRVELTGDHYQAILDSDSPMIQTILENYRCWAAFHHIPAQPGTKSSILFDTVAIYLAFASELLETRRMPIHVDHQGYMRETADAPVLEVATAWKDLDGFKDLLVCRLLG